MISSLPTIANAVEQIRAREITPLDLVEYCLARIRQFEDHVQAWVVVDEEGARRQAEELVGVMRDGEEPGSLAGIPVGIKDIIDVAGWPTKAGSPLREGHIAEADAPLVSRLREKGAIILGKTVTTEFACFDPPPTRNPWNFSRTPGGSSSGSAAAVALEMCMAAIGTQTGGSIIRPASYCGVCGLKPTFGHVPLKGVVPLSPNLDHAGPIARSVRDVARIQAEIMGFEKYVMLWLDSGFAEAPWQPTSLMAGRMVEPFMIHNLGPALHRPRLRVFDAYFMDETAPDVAAVTRDALSKIQDAWEEELALTLPASFSQVHTCHRRVMAVEAAEYHREAYAKSPEAFGPNIRALIEEGMRIPAVDYGASLRLQQCFREDLASVFDDGSIAIMPATNTVAPGTETTGDPRFNSPWSFAGIPAITIPCGLAGDGMPCGLQLVGPQNSEPRLLEAAVWCEERLKFKASPPMLTLD